jgi:hypothetical protein
LNKLVGARIARLVCRRFAQTKLYAIFNNNSVRARIARPGTLNCKQVLSSELCITAIKTEIYYILRRLINMSYYEDDTPFIIPEKYKGLTPAELRAIAEELFEKREKEGVSIRPRPAKA